MGFRFNQGDRPLSGYTIQRGVGRGGFGEVYYAVSDGGKEVALKYLAQNPEVELRGVSHCLNLKNPHLVTLYDVQQTADGDSFVIMEYVNGVSLRDLLNDSPSGLGTQKAAYFLREVGKGLSYLHDRGIVHRDLKPGNIFYEDGYVKIGDYGLAKLMSATQHSGQTVSVGTLHYMAPEVGSGNYDRTIDIYALGVMLYELLLGRVPFSGATMGEVLMKHLTAQPMVDELPEPFAQVIRKSLAKDPKDRYQTVPEMIAEVFSVADLDRSVAAFEPASLSTAAAKAARDAAATMVAPPRPMLGGSSNVGQGGGPGRDFGFHAEPALGGDRFRGVQQRIDRRLDDVAQRIDRSPLGQQVAGEGVRPGHWAGRPLIALLIAGGIAVIVSLMSAPNGKQGQYSSIAFMQIASILGATALGCWLSFDKLKVSGILLPRLIIMMIAAGPLISLNHAMINVLRHDAPAEQQAISIVDSDSDGDSDIDSDSEDEEEAAAKTRKTVDKQVQRGLQIAREQVNARARRSHAGHNESQNASLAIVLCLLMCDWAGRWYSGRRGKVSLGSSVKVAIFAFLAAAIFATNSFEIAAIMGAAALVVQSVGGLWPLPVGAVIPRTNRRDEPPIGPIQHVQRAPMRPVPMQPEFHRGSIGVAVEPGIDRSREFLQAGSTPISPIAPLANQKGTNDPLLARRSAIIRTMWLFASAVLVVSMILCFAWQAMVKATGNDETSINFASDERSRFIVGGVVLAGAFLFAFTRSWSGYHRGLWRGLIRPFIFLAGLTLAAACGTALGRFNFQPDEKMGCLGGILGGAVISLFVWFVPIGAYRGAGRSNSGTATSEENPKLLMAKRLRIAGIIAFSITWTLVPIFCATMENPRDVAESAPPVAIVGSLAGTVLLVISSIMGRAALGPRKKLGLPLKLIFEVDANPSLGSMIERHMAMLGYSLTAKSDLFWSFSRGQWHKQFWEEKLLQWPMSVNIAAYEVPGGGQRLTCYLDVKGVIRKPSAKQLEILHGELRELQTLVGGREAPSAV